jgi:putative membrane protein
MTRHHSLEAVFVAVVFAGGGIARDDKPLTDTTFVEKAATIGLIEVELGKLGSAVGQSPDVKRFADRMLRDHSAAYEELIVIATRIPVTFPNRLDDTHQKSVDAMKKLNGSEFDKAYMEQMVKDHEAAVDLFQKAEKDVSNSRLMDFAKKTLPTLEEQLKLAKEVRDKVK